ncbi:cellulose binding domain-containing protein [Rhizohabitans arisaemae]|uniref:cellulose binding domain-containing protein n=1 Tax=Rhizohabitans arisaemae TaxID=2720610 RepID=UPI0024B0DABD|nr:cellulose binding domain-containing protein [Rhizohabitans arisaemae]
MRLRALVVATAALVLSSGLIATPAHAASPTATFGKAQDWGSGYSGEYRITNSGTTTMSGWTVEFDLPAGSSVGSSWDATMVRTGNHYAFTNRPWNGNLAPNASAVFGWVNSGSGTPLNCKLNGGPCAGGGDTEAPTVPARLRVTGATATTIGLAWDASTDNSGVAPRYDVVRDVNPPVSVTGTTYTATGLAARTTYSFKVRACDGSGNCSGYGPSVPGVTTGDPPPPPGLTHAPYVDMGSWPTPDLAAMAAASGLKGFTLGFVTAQGGTCKASWFQAYDPDTAWAKDRIDSLRAAGGDVKISFGGAAHTELAQACTDANALYNEYNQVVTTYGLKHIDLDIEGGAVADTASVNRRSQVLARLQQTHPTLKVSLTLPVLPEGLTPQGLNVVRSARDAGVNVDVVNVMAMDYYRNVDYGDAAVQAAQSTFAQLRTLYPAKTDAQLWKMVGVTPMLGENDDHYIYNQADARQLVTFARSVQLGVLAFWDVTRDRNACTGPLWQCTNVPQTPYEFSRIFASYLG